MFKFIGIVAVVAFVLLYCNISCESTGGEYKSSVSIPKKDIEKVMTKGWDGVKQVAKEARESLAEALDKREPPPNNQELMSELRRQGCKAKEGKDAPCPM